MNLSKLTPQDLHFVLARVPKDVRDLMQTNGLYLGGGFIRETIAGGEVQDIDVFGATFESLAASAKALKTTRGESAILRNTPNAFTLLNHPRLPVQFITRWTYDDPLKVAESFDFTICMAAIWFDNKDREWRSACHEDFYSDLAARRLVYTFPVREEAAGGSMLRVRKFLMRGYNIQAESLAGVISRLVGNVPATMKEKDKAKTISNMLREVDPLRVVEGNELFDEHQTL